MKWESFKHWFFLVLSIFVAITPPFDWVNIVGIFLIIGNGYFLIEHYTGHYTVE